MPKIYLQSSKSVYPQLINLLKQSANTNFSLEARKTSINDFYSYYYEDVVENRKNFFEKKELARLIEQKQMLIKQDYSFPDILSTYNFFLQTKENFTDKLTKTRPIEERFKYTFDYYFYFLDILAEYIYFCYKHNNDPFNTNTNKQKTKLPILFGIQAGQGLGKTTICEMLTFLLSNKYGLKVFSFSTDDYYYPYSRQIENFKVNKEFRYRGPPGTHDIALLSQMISNFKLRKSGYFVEKFNKKLNNGFGDRIQHSDDNLIKEPLDILICEGWFNGIKPVKEEELINYFNKNRLNNLNIDIDSVIGLQKKVNKCLNEWQAIWNEFDRFIIIKPEEYEYSKKWRLQTEKEKGGLSEFEILDFINYMWTAVPPNIYFDRMLEKDYNIRSDSNYALFPLILNCDFDRNYYVEKPLSHCNTKI